jgi:uncharacterized protein
MHITEMTFPQARPIDGYGPGFFRIGGLAIDGAVLITSDGVRGWGGFDESDTLLALAGTADLVLIGTGAEMQAVPGELVQALETAGLAFEAMASPAACRTYNVLLGDARRIALAALPV